MSTLMLEFQFKLALYVLEILVKSEIRKDAIREIENQVKESFLHRRGSRSEAKELLTYIEEGMEMGLFEKDDLLGVRSLLSIVAEGA